MKVGQSNVVGRLVSAQPPWSIAKSMMTAPRPHHNVGEPCDVGDVEVVIDHRVYASLELVIEVAQTIERPAQDKDLSAQSQEGASRVLAHGARPQNDHFTGGDTRHTIQQDAATSVLA